METVICPFELPVEFVHREGSIMPYALMSPAEPSASHRRRRRDSTRHLRLRRCKGNGGGVCGVEERDQLNVANHRYERQLKARREMETVKWVSISDYDAVVAQNSRLRAACEAAIKSGDDLGMWLSAAMGDKDSCAEFKAHIEAWMDSHLKLTAALEQTHESR